MRKASAKSDVAIRRQRIGSVGDDEFSGDPYSARRERRAYPTRLTVEPNDARSHALPLPHERSGGAQSSVQVARGEATTINNYTLLISRSGSNTFFARALAVIEQKPSLSFAGTGGQLPTVGALATNHAGNVTGN